MPSIRKLNKKLAKMFEGQIEASVEDGRLLLTGELERWIDVVRAGVSSVIDNPCDCLVNDIECTGEKSLPIRKPNKKDSILEHESIDVLIIGGGIIGCSVARELSRYKLSVLVIEKEHDLAMHATGHCGGIVHSGINLNSQTKKHWYCKLGNPMFDDLCKELSVPFNRCGQYLCYPRSLWTPLLRLVQFIWRWRGQKGATVVSGDDLHRKEPGINRNISTAIYFPSAGVVCPHTLTIACAENAMANGVYFVFDAMVQDMEVDNNVISGVVTNRGTIKPKIVINTAGAFCDDIAEMAGDRFFSIHPVRGTHEVFDSKFADELAHSIISVSASSRIRRMQKKISTVNISRSVHGPVLVGHDTIETINKEDFSTNDFTSAHVLNQAKKMAPKIDEQSAMTRYSGINAATYDGDFIVSKGRNVSNIIHAAGIQSPGLTASPAIAAEIADMVVAMFGGKQAVLQNPDFDPIRKTSPTLSQMSVNERAALISENPDYGIIVCKCESVSKGEIVDALNRNIKCESLDGVKRRVRVGCGSCQGVNCSPSLLNIFATEKRIMPLNVRKSGGKSHVVLGNAALIAKAKNDARRTASATRAFSITDDYFKNDDDDNSEDGN